MRIIRNFLVTGFVALLLMSQTFLISGVSASTFSSLQAFGVDTIAGYSTLLSTSKIFPDQDIVFNLKKPDGATISIPTKTNSDGVAKIDLYDYHTRRAGDYLISAYVKGNSNIGSVSTFTVYPDEVSTDKSTIVAQRSVIKADGMDKAYLTVNIADQYGNPFTGHVIRVISSRATDEVMVATNGSTTDINGSVTFTTTSSDPGVSIFSAVDATSGIVLTSRSEVAFLNSSSYLSNAGGHLEYFIPVASAEDAGPLSKFEISGISEFVEPNTNVSFMVTAQDDSGLTVENYTGEIHFSAEGPSSINVTLPEDYTFKAEDLGAHQFSLGLKFTETGTYKIVVTDISNQIIKGEKNVAVSTGSESQPPPSSGGDISITTPTAGTYSQNVQTISGSAANLSVVKIYDNDQEIGNTTSGSDGKFTFQTVQLADGEHSLYAVWLDDGDEVQGTSDTVMINIDTTPPTVDEVEITPTTDIKAGDIINVKVLSEENLSQASIIFNLEIYDLSPSLEQDGAYIASFQAPVDAGDYPMDVLLIDELGNEDTYAGVKTLSIGADGGSFVEEEVTPDEEVPEEPVETEGLNESPSQVFGIIAYGADKKVTLVWEAATDDVIVDHYKIYYGADPTNLTDVVHTNDAATTWYIPDLVNGQDYYFAVSAVDDAQVESLFTSDLVNSIPFTLEVESALPDRPVEPLGFDDPALLRGAAVVAPPKLSEDGPELLWLLVGTGGLSGLARRFSRRKKK